MSADEVSYKNTKQTLSEMNSQNLVKIQEDSQPSAGTWGNVIWAIILNSQDMQSLGHMTEQSVNLILLSS